MRSPSASKARPTTQGRWPSLRCLPGCGFSGVSKVSSTAVRGVAGEDAARGRRPGRAAGWWEGERDPLLNAIYFLLMYAKRRHKPVRNLHNLAKALEKGDGRAAEKYYERWLKRS